MAEMVRNPAKTMDKKIKLAGWLFPMPTRWCGVRGNSLNSSSVVIFHTVSRMKRGWSYNLSRRSGRGWILRWKFWTEECEKHWFEWWETPHTAWRAYLQSKVFGRLEHQRGAKIFFAKRRSRIRPCILRPAPPEWIRCC